MGVNFSEKIKKLKEDLKNKSTKNDEGYFQVEPEEFYKYLKTAAEEYKNYITSLKQEGKKSKKKFENPFHFKNLSLAINWHKFCQQLSSIDDNTRKYINNEVVFEKCNLTKLGLEGIATIRHNFFEIHLISSKVSELSVNYGFSNNVSLFHASKTNIEIIRFQGDSKASFITEILKFTECVLREIHCHSICRFNILWFDNCIFGNKEKDQKQIISFNNSEFLNTTKFINCKFFISPKFHNIKIHSDTSFDNTEFYDIHTVGSVADYRALKQCFHSIGDEQKSLEFAAYELDARRKTVLPKWNIFHREFIAGMASLFLKLANNYGRNFWLPWMWLIGGLLVFTFIYWYFKALDCNYDRWSYSDLWLREYCDICEYNGWRIPLLYSFQKFWGPLGLILDSGLLSPKNTGMKIISIIQFIFSSILWYIIIVQIRRQFRL